MTAKQYKEICQRPDVLSRGAIEATAQLLPDHRDRLNEILSGIPLEKPAIHRGAEESDYFCVTFSAREALEIVEQLLWSEAEDAESCPPRAGFSANLVDNWSGISGV